MSEFILGTDSFFADQRPQRESRHRKAGPSIDWSATAAGPGKYDGARPGSMAEDFDAPARESRARTRRRGLERGLGIVMAALGASVLAAGTFLFLPSALRVSHYEVRGATSLSNAEVLQAALVRDNEYFFSIEPARMKAALLREPRIASAKVERRFPNAVYIDIAERKPAAIVLVDEAGRLVPVCIDREGIAYAYASTALASAGEGDRLQDLPILSGLRFEGFKPGTRLPAALVPALAALGDIRARSPALLAAFSEIKLVKPAHGEAELILYSLHHRVPVRTGAVLNEATLRSIILVLDVLGSQGLSDKVEEIDFRTGTVVYRVKEGHPD
jgi:cell division protein FtsQ